MARLLSTRPEYVSIDLDPDERPAMMQADVQDLPFADKQFELVLCCHVLEHVDDDMQAMRELRRVGKRVLMQHPIDYDLAETYEDPAITSPEERLAVYGQEDHVRIYGRDFGDRLRAAGFEYTVIARRGAQAGLRRDEIFDCR